jgi:hypothetical protein
MLNLNLTPPAHIKGVYTFFYIEAKISLNGRRRRRREEENVGPKFVYHPPTNCGLRPERDRSLIDIQTQQQQQVDTRTTKTNPNCFFFKTKREGRRYVHQNRFANAAALINHDDGGCFQ